MYQCMSDDYFKLLARVCNRTRPLIALKGVASFFFHFFLVSHFFFGVGNTQSIDFQTERRARVRVEFKRSCNVGSVGTKQTPDNKQKQKKTCASEGDII